MPFVGTVDIAIFVTLRSVLLDTALMEYVPQNSGLTRPIKIIAPKGCLANPIYPAPVITRCCPGNIVSNAGEPANLPSKFLCRKTRPGDTLRTISPSGGGYGDPLKRDPNQILEDVLNGYASLAKAEQDYKVVIVPCHDNDRLGSNRAASLLTFIRL